MDDKEIIQKLKTLATSFLCTQKLIVDRINEAERLEIDNEVYIRELCLKRALNLGEAPDMEQRVKNAADAIDKMIADV